MLPVWGIRRCAERVDVHTMSGESLPLRALEGSGQASNGRRRVRVRDVEIGGDNPTVVAGPCAVESAEQTFGIARAVLAAGAHLLRGGAFKPRTSPYDFQGLGEDGLRILADAREETGLGVVTEVLDVRQIEVVARYADMLQVGSRSMQNFPLLRELGRQPKPVLLKRGAAATMHEWLGAAEYIASEGNTQIVLCERGIRTPSDGEYARYTLDVTAVEAVRRVVDLPVLVDPSHATGSAGLVPRAALAGIAAGADGLLIEVIGDQTDRSTVRCDAIQGIRPAVLESIIRAIPLVCEAGRLLVIEETGAVVEAPDGAA